jgi:hypothetical protein
MNHSIPCIDLGVDAEAGASVLLEHELGRQQLKIVAQIRRLSEIIVFGCFLVAPDHPIVREQFPAESPHLLIDFLKTKNVRIQSLLSNECGYALSNSAVPGVQEYHFHGEDDYSKPLRTTNWWGARYGGAVNREHGEFLDWRTDLRRRSLRRPEALARSPPRNGPHLRREAGGEGNALVGVRCSISVTWFVM